MIASVERDRAALALGVASLVSLVFLVVGGAFGFVTIRSWGIVVAVLLGLLAVAGGWTGRRTLTVVAGAGFVAAAVVQVVGWAGESNVLGGDGSTVSLWLGLGVGLLAVGLAPRIWPDLNARGDNR
jgi:hypothetical protein